MAAAGFEIKLTSDGQPLIFWQQDSVPQLKPKAAPKPAKKDIKKSKPPDQPRAELPHPDKTKPTPAHNSNDQIDGHSGTQTRPVGKPPFELPSDEELMKLSTDQLKSLYSALSGGVEKAPSPQSTPRKEKRSKKNRGDSELKLKFSDSTEPSPRRTEAPVSVAPAESPREEGDGRTSGIEPPSRSRLAIDLQHNEGARHENILNLAESFQRREEARAKADSRRQHDKKLLADAVRRKPRKREERVVLQDPNGSRVSLGESDTKKQVLKSKPPPAPRARPAAAAPNKSSLAKDAAKHSQLDDREQPRRAGRPPRATRSRDDLDAEPRENARQRQRQKKPKDEGLKRRSHTDSDLSAAEDERPARASVRSRAADVSEPPTASREAPEDAANAASRARVTSELIAQLTKLGVLGPSSPRAANMPSLNLATGQPPTPLLAGPQTQSNQRFATSGPPASVPQLSGSSQPAAESQLPPPSPTLPKQHMRRAEWKRQQWESERVENARTGLWNPFGKPGGGAPIGGLPSPTGAPPFPPFSYSGFAPAGAPVQPVLYARSAMQPADAAFPLVSPGAPQAQPVLVGQPLPQMAPPAPQAALPAAIRSTFATGAMVPTESMYDDSKEAERLKWLDELNRQREDRVAEKARKRASDAAANAQFSTSGYFLGDTPQANARARSLVPPAVGQQQLQQPPPQLQPQPQVVPLPAAAVVWSAQPQPLNRTYEYMALQAAQQQQQAVSLAATYSMSIPGAAAAAPTASAMIQQLFPTAYPSGAAPGAPSLNASLNLTGGPSGQMPDGGSTDPSSQFLRGSGLASLIDPVTRKELDEKKRRDFAHQEAIRSQIEERERLKLLKKQQKILQDIEDEMRIKRELAEQELAYEGEQTKHKTRLAERAQLTEHALQNATAQHALSIAEKQLAQMRRLAQQGVDVSHLEEEFNKTKLQLLDTVRKEKTAAQLPRLESSPPTPASPAAEAREAPLPEAAPSPPAQSNERLLTPSKYRHMNRKEFGVQADLISGANPRDRAAFQMARMNPELEATLEALRREPSAGFEFREGNYPEAEAPPAREEAARAKQTKGARKPPPAGKRQLDARLPQRFDAGAGMEGAKQPSKTRVAPPGDRRGGRRNEVRTNDEENISALISKSRQPRERCQEASGGVPVSRQRTQSETRSRIPVAMQRSEAPARAQADGAPRGRVAQRPPVDRRAITPPPGPQFTERRAPSPPVPAIQRRIALHTQRGPSVQGGGYEAENYSSPRAEQQYTYELSEYKLPRKAPEPETTRPSLRVAAYDPDIAPFKRSAELVFDPESSLKPPPARREDSAVARSREIFETTQRPDIYGLEMAPITHPREELRAPPSRNAPTAQSSIVTRGATAQSPSTQQPVRSSLQTASTQPASGRDSQLLFQQLAAIRAELARKRHELDVLAPGPQPVHNN